VIETTIQGVDLRLETAKGLFSPARIDQGTLAMLRRIEFTPDDKVLDLGCGYGVVGILAARLVGPERVWLLDNDPAAVAVARRNLDLNGAAGARCLQSDGFRDFSEAGFSKIICNPPYHANFSTPKHIIEKGFNRLTVGGGLWLVTRRQAWYRNKLAAIFGGARVFADGGYFVFEAVRRSSSYAR
jgi:16S rRNA (guanine1207-N2)-methyltransferase